MHNRVILITGASSDIGLEVIRRCHSADTQIIAHCNSRKNRLEELQKEGVENLHIAPCDFSDFDSTSAWIQELIQRFSCPTHVVHLPAPKFQYIRLKKSSWPDLQRSLDVELRSIFSILQRVLPLMAERKKGKVVFMLSSFTLGVPPRALTHYCTTKYALLGLMRSLASEFADKGIDINGVSPSTVETTFLSNMPPQILEAARDANPRKRTVTAAEVASVINTLLSDAISFISGVNIPITGGENF